MENEALDRFLNCVLQRSRKDRFLDPLVILLIIPGSLFMEGLIMLSIYLDWGVVPRLSVSGQFCLVMFLVMEVSFILYILMKSMTFHTRRDAVWTESLTEYAEGKGKDVSELRRLSDDMVSNVIERGSLVAFLAFLAISFFMLLIFFLIDFIRTPEDTLLLIENTFIIAVIAEALVIFMLITLKMDRLDSTQCRFTVLFEELMGDELMAGCMYLKRRDLKKVQAVLLALSFLLFLTVIVTHDILEDDGIVLYHTSSPIVLFLMIYSVLLFFYTVYVMNRHLRAQWGYESKLLAMISVHEGVKSVKRFKIEYDEDDQDDDSAGSLARVKRFFRHIADEI